MGSQYFTPWTVCIQAHNNVSHDIQKKTLKDGNQKKKGRILEGFKTLSYLKPQFTLPPLHKQPSSVYHLPAARSPCE